MTSEAQMAGSPPNFHKMDSRSACIQGVLKVKDKVKDHVIRALLGWHENRFFSQANGRIATKLAHDGLQVSLHPGCAQGQGQRSRDTRTFLDSWNGLLRHWRSGWEMTTRVTTMNDPANEWTNQQTHVIRILPARGNGSGVFSLVATNSPLRAKPCMLCFVMRRPACWSWFFELLYTSIIAVCQRL